MCTFKKKTETPKLTETKKMIPNLTQQIPTLRWEIYNQPY